MRQWDEYRYWCGFVGLNPSTADEKKDDPTIRRCINYAKSWGYGGLYMLNVFAYRATNPLEMKSQTKPIGYSNAKFLARISARCLITVCAWGNHGNHLKAGDKAKEIINRPHYLELNKNGTPKHPLYLKGDLKPKEWK